MQIQKTSTNVHYQSPEVKLAVELVGDGVEFSSLFVVDETNPTEDHTPYTGKRFVQGDVVYGVINCYRFDCSELQSSNQWGDVASWHIYKTPTDTLFAENLHAETIATKASSAQYSSSLARLPVAVGFVPWADSSIADVKFLLNVADSSVLIAGSGVTVVNYNGSPAQWRSEQMPTIALTGPSTIAADGLSQFAATVSRSGSVATDCDSEICIETTGGYLPLQRARCQAGVANFKLHASHMTAGDAFKIKVGFRNYSGMASKTLTVS
jgi:hypothetical protein